MWEGGLRVPFLVRGPGVRPGSTDATPIALHDLYPTFAALAGASESVPATVQGGSQGLSRSVYGSMVPRAQSSEFFGFFSVTAKFAGILGPLLFALVSQLAGSSRPSIVALVVFFIGGMIILSKVDIEEGQRIARLEDAKFEDAPANA